LNRIAQGLTLVLLGAAALTSTVLTDLYLNWVKAGFGPFLTATGVIMVLLGALGDMKIEGAYVSPDQMDIKMRLSGQELGFVQIGKKAWVKFGGGWQATDAGDSFSFGQSPTELLPVAGANTSAGCERHR
jgi:hypothetical protein